MITKNNLIDWLKEIDKNLDKKISLIAVGGTAMTLLGLKPSTRDIDFCVEKGLKEFKELAKKSKFIVDIFTGGYIFSEQLPEDYIDKSIKMELNLNKVELRTLSLIDIVLTKAARYNARDEEDIATLAKTKKINKKELEKRFKEIIGTYAGRSEDYEYHFDLILRRHFS